MRSKSVFTVRFWLPLLLVLPLAALSCHDEPTPDPVPDPDPVPGAPATLKPLVAAQNQTAEVNGPVPVPPSVQVVDAAGRGVPGIGVTFSAQSGGGSVTGGTQATDGSGIATVNGWRMGPAPGPNALAVQVSGLPTFVFNATATVPPLGSLAVTVAGLPAGVAPLITVTGPNGYAADVFGSVALTALPVGAYTIAAQPVQQGTYSPAPASQTVNVAAGATTQATVVYSAGAPLNLVLDGALFFQTVQSAQGTVPMMADKPAILRVWVRSTRANTHQVPVRLRIFRGSQILHDTIALGPAAVPTQYNAGDAGASWNIRVRGELMQTGISVSIQVDPNNAVPETTENDNLFPATGAAPVGVQAVPPFRVRFLRICTAYPPYACGQVGGGDDMLRMLYTVFPVWQRELIQGYQWNTIRDVSSNAGWMELLNDIAALRVADGFGATGVHYMGILTSPTTLLGLAQIGGFSGLAKNDDAQAPITIAHELGHNFGRRHAPCGGAPDTDPAFPTPDASVGTYGVDIFNGQVTTPTYKDIMSYCPPNMTASEYTYRHVMQARQGPLPVLSAEGTSPRPILVVAGRLMDGVLTLDPAFDATATPVVPSGGGRFLLEGVDQEGKTLFSYRFEPTEAGHRAGKAYMFAFGIPMAAEARARLYEVRLSDGVRRVSRRSMEDLTHLGAGTGGGHSAAEAVRISREGGGVRVRWNASRYEALWLRETRSGRLIAMLRGGSGRVATTETEFNVQLSDGVQTVHGKVRTR